MFIVNCNLRKRLGIYLAADDGAGSGGEGSETNSTDGTGGEGEGAEETTPEENTFTQADVDKLIKDRVAREKKGQLSKDEIKAYQDWKESQKTDEEKKNEALTNAEKAKQDAEERALNAETKVTCLSKGVIASSVDDVVILAKAMVNDELTIEQAIDKVLEKYPSFKGEQQKNNEDESKGFKIGAGTEKQKGNVDDVLARAFGNK
ncbi:hypothetical protein K5V21_13795 [Clostridium sardiniense]|uniref:DUF4355 domain-containing protein n=1 Tax=Clostridium sardiniense TaxID=29369 RepID=A0ABS7L0D1_CLOSR|nr:hypothetical protein [Clostridium sardiniense]MBY0756518.1 hypothetical protein [Clostridium sardiniense]MDQ0460265.1 hypothetical protein [Clostridium sardiniense]